MNGLTSIGKNRLSGFDFIRAFAIAFVFLGHIVNKQSHNDIALFMIRSISPGLTMSVLGFISAYLIVTKYVNFDGKFYVKRLSRIYSSLGVCLLAISLIHIILSYDVVNQHTIIHFLGLSFFLNLLQVTNNSSIGIGLWFITIIIIMYLLLPLLSVLYRHKYSKIHLMVVVLFCMFLDKNMYGTMSAWNVVIAFNIGCYVGINSSIEIFTRRSYVIFLLPTLIMILLSGLSSIKILPSETTIVLLPFYPIFAVPLLYKIGNSLEGLIRTVVNWFSSVSYEVYILHFYFINDYFHNFFPSIESIFVKIFIAIIIVIPMSFALSKVSTRINNIVIKYLF